MNINKKKQLLIIILMFLNGCSGSPPQEGTSIDRMEGILNDGIEANTKREQTFVAPPADIQQGLLPPLDMGIPDEQGKLVEQRFDISVDNVSAKQFFMGLVEGTSYNMIVHPEVAGNISLKLKDVTIDEVMETVRDVFGYEYRKNGSGYQVIRAGMRTKIFQVNYLNIQRSGTSRMRVSSGEVSQAGSSGDTNTTSTDNASVSGTELTTESSTDFWTELSATLKMVVGTEGGRSVVASPQSGVVLVRAMPNELRDVAGFIETIQSIIQRQVVIEAKILEVELNDGFQSGINWAGIAEDNKGRTAVFGQTGGGSAITSSGAGTSGIAGNLGDLSPTGLSQVSGTDVSAFGGIFTLALNFNDFTSFIELLETQGNVQVLSSPRVSTLNNQKAVIKVGNDEFFVTEVSSTTTSGVGGGVATSPDITLTPFFSGIALDVTPQINEKQEVILHIRPMVSEVSDQQKDITVGGQVQSLPLAFSSIRESDSIIRAGSGQLVVIGGLMKDTTREDVASVPLLGDIPFVGSLFRHTKQSSHKSELVILLRPVVIGGDKGWRDSLMEAANAIKGTKRGFHYGSKKEVFGAAAE